MKIIQRSVGILIAICVASGVMGTNLYAQEHTFEQWIAPLECVEEEITDGISTITYLTPEECDELLNPDDNTPDKPIVTPTTPTDTLGTPKQRSPLLATYSYPTSYKQLSLAGVERNTNGIRVADRVNPSGGTSIRHSGLIWVLLAAIICWLLWQAAFREGQLFKRILAKRKR